MYELKNTNASNSGSFLSAEIIAPIDILYEFEGPRVFTTIDKYGIQMLAVQSDESSHSRRFLVVDCSVERIQELKYGILTLYEALNQPRLNVVDVSAENFVVKSSVLSSLKDIPLNRKPVQGAMLYSELQPELSIRIISAEAIPGSISGSLLNDAFSRVKSGILVLAERAKQKISTESKLWKELQNPVAQKFAFRSFEVSFRFGFPTDAAQSEIYSEIKSLFLKGVSLLNSRYSGEADFVKNSVCIVDSEEDAFAICAAFKEFAPSSKNQCSAIELSGTMISSDKELILTSADYKILRSYVNSRTKKVDEMVEFTGKIMECDRQAQSFELRNITNSGHINLKEIRCNFTISQEEAVLDAFNSGCEVVVSGVQKANSNSLEVSLVKLVYPT